LGEKKEKKENLQEMTFAILGLEASKSQIQMICDEASCWGNY